MRLCNFKRVNYNEILAEIKYNWFEKLLGRKDRTIKFIPKGTYKVFYGVNVYYDEKGNEWDDRRITVFDKTGIDFKE